MARPNVNLTASSASTGGGGGGGGTVTNVSGTANQIDVATGTTTPVISLDSTLIAPGSVAATTSLASGANSGAAGQIILNGSTSGSATITAPAIAGTVGNPIVISNSIQLQNGTQALPALRLTTAAYGFYYGTSITGWVFSNGSNTDQFAIGGNSSHIGLLSNGLFTFGSSSTTLNAAGMNSDTTISRNAAGVVQIGTGITANALGALACASVTAGGNAGVTAGSFSAITAITTTGGIVTQLTGSSDERLKDSVPYKGGLEEILNITPIKYRWNDKGQEHTGLSGDKEYVGFSAQDVQKQIPECITGSEPSKSGDEEYLSFDPRPIIAALVNSVKELKAEVDNLRNQLLP